MRILCKTAHYPIGTPVDLFVP